MPLKVFPVVGPVHYSDDFNVQKPDGRYHRATDIFAAMGAPVVAVDDGVAKGGTDPKGGNVVHLKTADADFYYAHLVGSTAGIDGPVKAGDPLGGVGMTGNAIYTTPHLHFAMRVNGAPVDPYPLLREAEKVPATTASKSSNTAAVIAGVTMIAGAVAAALVITRGPHRRPRLRSAYAR